MSNLIVNLQLPQLRMYPIPGVSSFRYERMVCGKWVECNHSRARGVVGVFNRRAKALCEKLTGSSKTTMAIQSELSAGSQGYSHECFSPLDQFQRKFREVEGSHEQ